MESTRPIDQHRSVIAAARAALEMLGADLHGAFNEELGELLSEVDALVAAGGGVRAEVLLETKRRGIMLEFGKDTRQWVITYAPSLRQAGAGQLAMIVDTLAKRTTITAGCDYDDPRVVFDRAAPIAMIWAHVRTGEVGAPLALAVLKEMDKLDGRIQPEYVETVTMAMLAMGVGHGPAGMRDLKMRLIAEHGLPEEAERAQRRLAKHAFLTSPQPESGDLTRYSMGLTPEQSAILEAALGPLSKPQPNPQTGEPDPRTAGQRRAEALTELCRRMATTDAHHKGGPAESDACLFITLRLEDLQGNAGAGEVIASRAGGTILGMDTLRKISCDADLIPIVLGTDSQVLDHGMTVRLFTRAQRRAIWRRDKTCTYPGCTAPAAWTKVHHIQHWADGGPTNLNNAALLCQRHHTHVHQKRLWADISPTPDDTGTYVTWDLTPGSYDHAARQHGWAQEWTPTG